jgi:stage V sporulation protein G
MQLTEIRVFPVDEDKLKAYVTVTFDHCFVIRDIKIITGTSGYFVSMPSKKRKDGTYKDIAHPINQQTRAMIEQQIIGEYHKALAETAAKKASSLNREYHGSQ